MSSATLLGDPVRTPLAADAAPSESVLTLEHFEMLFSVYYRRVVAVIYRIVEHHEIAEDVAQEAWLRTWKALANGATIKTEAVRTWLFKIATHTAYDYLRRRQFVLTSLESAAEVAAVERFEEQIAERDLALRVLRALSPEEARLLYAAYGRDIPYSRIGAALQLKPNALKMRVMRARARFRQVYAQVAQ